jgi:hypothetical protein
MLTTWHKRGVAVMAALVLAACATPAINPPPDDLATPTPGSVLRAERIDPALARRILALDPDHVTGDDVHDTLAKGPTPRIINIHGGIYPVYLLMESFARFLSRMGYPEARIHDPGTGAVTHSPYGDSAQLAGEIAWLYEHEGVAPMLVGHSQGGMQVVKVLYQLAGKLDESVQVFNPIEQRFEDRVTILDPLTGATRPLTSLTVDYASAVAAGGVAMLTPNQWNMAGRLYRIPDSVVDFTGFSLGLDLIALDGPNTPSQYRPLGTAHIRNVQLPATYSHVFVVDTGGLAKDAHTRDWLNAWTPALQGKDPPADVDAPNILWAADVWFSIKRHWVLEAQQFVRAQQALAGH